MTSRRLGSIVFAMGLAASVSSRGRATERQFTYTYGSQVLNPGTFELEPWTTVGLGRDAFYVRFDHRLEFEIGVTERLQTAFYFNWSAVNQDIGSVRAQEFSWQGVSWEWKYKLLDPVADPVGLALYVEPTFGPTEAELEGKVIVDKRVGDFYLAFNGIVENEWEFAEKGRAASELAIEETLGVAYFLAPALAAGIEARNHNLISEGDLEHASLFAGPVISYASHPFWVAATFLSQLPALKSHGPNSTLVLDDHERFSARLLFGWHL